MSIPFVDRPPTSALLAAFVAIWLCGCDAPRITSINPHSLPHNADVAIALNGANFTAGSSLVLDGNVNVGNGIQVVGPIIFIDSDNLNASIRIDANAPLGAHLIAVGTAEGISEAHIVFVDDYPPAPRLFGVLQSGQDSYSLGPTSQGQTRLARFSGLNFLDNNPVVSISGSGVSVDTTVPLVVVVEFDSEYFELPIVVALDATTGEHLVTVSTTGGISGAIPITVTAPTIPPRITGVTVSAAGSGCLPAGLDYLTITGDNFGEFRTRIDVTYIDAAGNAQALVGQYPQLIDVHTLEVYLSVPVSGDGFDVIATTNGGASAPFTMDCSSTPTPTPSVPVLTSVTPTYLTKGSRVSIKCAGNNFGAAPLVLVPGLPSPDFYPTVTADPDRVSVIDVFVPTTVGASGTISILDQSVFPNVESAPVTLIFAEPIPGRPFVSGTNVLQGVNAGGDLDFSIFGSDLLGTTDASWSGVPGLQFSNTVVNSSTQVSVHVHADATTPLTGDEANNLTVTTAAGQSNPFSLIVSPP
jgi:hypothetical protein